LMCLEAINSFSITISHTSIMVELISFSPWMSKDHMEAYKWVYRSIWQYLGCYLMPLRVHWGVNPCGEKFVCWIINFWAHRVMVFVHDSTGRVDRTLFLFNHCGVCLFRMIVIFPPRWLLVTW
jgi:hypothetical protein